MNADIRPGDPDKGCSIVVLISGRGSNLAAILERQQQGGLEGGEVVAVFSNRPDAPGLSHARKYNIPVEVLNHRDYSGREDFDEELSQRIENYKPHLVVLAGFMRILTGRFTEQFSGRLINTHPSLLPLFPGMDAVGQALEAGVTETGCTVHFVTEVVDGGPIIAQTRVLVYPEDSKKAVEGRILRAEHQLLPRTIAAFCRASLGGQTLDTL